MTEMQTAGADEHADEIDIIELLTGIGEAKWLIFGLTSIAGLGALVVSLLLTPIFTARTTLLPPQQSQGGASALAASLGALSGFGGIAKTPEEMYVGLIKSDSIARILDEKFALKDRYEVKTFEALRVALGGRVTASVDRKSTLITVTVDDPDAKFAAQLANAYVTELRILLSRIAVTDAQQRRVYFEQQMANAKEELSKAEYSVKKSQETGGLVSLDAQTQALIGAAAQLRGQIVAKEVQIQALRPYAGPENPELRRVASELQSLRTQLGRLESGPQTSKVAASDAKESLGNVRLYRELKFQEAVYTAMLQQFQLAKAEEAKDAPLVQQVDVAVPPDWKSKPQRAFIVIISALAGLFFGVCFAGIRFFVRQQRADEVSAARWQSLKKAWSWRRR